MKLIVILVSFLSLGNCGENSVSINVKNVVNNISERFISYEVDSQHLISSFQEGKALEKLNIMSPAFIRLQGFSSVLKNETLIHVHGADIVSMFKTFIESNITPVIVIDYDTSTFEPLKLLQDLKTARDLKINECVWQLGDNSVNLFDRASLQKYSDDLKTLKVLCESVKKEHNLNWNVAADSSLYNNYVEKLPFDVVGYDLMRISSLDVLSKLNAINYKSQAPTWITIDSSYKKTSNSKQNASANMNCDQECVLNGLLHAQVLGDAARKGFDVLFLHDEQTNAFANAVSVLHKKLVGQKVFNVRVTKSSPDSKLMNLYSYCSKKQSGAITLMGINFSNMRSKFNVKISSPVESNSIVMQYLLSAADGKVFLNNEKFNQEATPSYKFKKLSKFSISLVLPPFSMAFWTIKNAKVNECLNIEDVKGTEVPNAPLISSSTDKLLKKLVANEFESKRSNSIEKISRSKRQISGSNQYLPKFELELPFKFPSLMTSSSNHKPIKEILFNKNTDIYKVSPVETNPLQSSENPTLPSGDVYLLINDGKNLSDSVDYVSDNREGPKGKRTKVNRKKSNANKIVYKEATEEPDYLIPHDYLDASHKTTKRTSKKSPKQEPKKEVGELFEAEIPSTMKGRAGDQKSLSSNVELKTVIRELEPTYRQNKAAVVAAKRKWDRAQIMELLKDAQLEEVDRAVLSNADDFEVVDLTNNSDMPMYDENDENEDEEDEDDDDDFFNEDLHRIRTRRDVNYAKNEIPKHGNHHFIDEDDESTESLLDDVHLYLPPRNENRGETHLISTTQSPSTTTPSIPIQAINFFSKSLTDAIDVAHKTLLGWWYVFNPSDVQYS